MKAQRITMGVRFTPSIVSLPMDVGEHYIRSLILLVFTFRVSHNNVETSNQYGRVTWMQRS